MGAVLPQTCRLSPQKTACTHRSKESADLDLRLHDTTAVYSSVGTKHKTAGGLDGARSDLRPPIAVSFAWQLAQAKKIRLYLDKLQSGSGYPTRCLSVKEISVPANFCSIARLRCRKPWLASGFQSSSRRTWVRRAGFPGRAWVNTAGGCRTRYRVLLRRDPNDAVFYELCLARDANAAREVLLEGSVVPGQSNAALPCKLFSG